MQDPTEASPEEADDAHFFYLRTVAGSSGQNTIVLQNKNGPCALVAIANTLVLSDTPTARFVRESELGPNKIDEEALKAHLGQVASAQSTDFVSVLAEYLPKLTRGLDVNPRFDGTFDPTPEVQVFASFGIPIVHGWVLGDVEREEFGVTDEKLSQISYEEFCTLQFSDTPNKSLARFAQAYQSQLTPSGFMWLQDTIPEGGYAVLFWNNHFSTLLNHQGRLLILATDLGYQNRPEIVWEVLEPSGAGQYLNGNFEPSNQQLDCDAELAKQLDQEEQAANRQSRPRSSQDLPQGSAVSKSAPAEGAVRPKKHKAHSQKDHGDVRHARSGPASHSSKSAGTTKKKQRSDRCILM